MTRPSGGFDEKLGLTVHEVARKSALVPTPEFVTKGLGNYAVEAGLICDIACAYCSSRAIYRMQSAIAKLGHSSFDEGFAAIDPGVPDRLVGELGVLTSDDTVIVSTKTDSWSPVAREHQIGRRSLEAILTRSKATVRIISKSSKVSDDFDLIAKHRDRVLLGLSITGLPRHDRIVGLYERNACPPSARIETMREAARGGFRTFAMFCPMFPGLFSTTESLRELVDLAVEWNCEGIWSEVVNPRGPGVQRCVALLQAGGEHAVAAAFNSMRFDTSRSQYGMWLTRTLQGLCRERGIIQKLHVLSYRSSFTETAMGIINRDPEGVIWL